MDIRFYTVLFIFSALWFFVFLVLWSFFCPLDSVCGTSSVLTNLVVYISGFMFGLIPIMAEVYNLDGPYYYAVAVTKQRDNSSELIYLKTKNTCHTVSFNKTIT